MLVHPDGTSERTRCATVGNVHDLPGPVDLVVLAIKTGSIRHVCTELAPLLETVPVLTLQNGIGAVEMLEQELGSSGTIVPGVTYISGTSLAVDRIRESAVGATVLGRRPGNDQALKELHSLFTAATLPVSVSDGWQVEQWKKLIAASAINGCAAVLSCTVGELGCGARATELVVAVAEETAAVARASGIDLGIIDMLAFITSRLDGSSANRPSMLQDLEAGRDTEVDYITGAVIAAARATGVPAPLNESLYRLICARQEITRRECRVAPRATTFTVGVDA